jgi:mannose-6-phosphate isomerase
MVEVQEPTDFSIVAEWRDFPIDPADAALGRDWEEMVDAFDRAPMTPERLAGLRQAPRDVGTAGPLRRTALLGAQAERFFRADRLGLDGECAWPMTGWALAVVVDGRGSAAGPSAELPLRRGVTFALTASAARRLRIAGRGLSMIVCRPGTEPPRLAR